MMLLKRTLFCVFGEIWSSIERKTGPLVGQGIRALSEKDLAVRAVFGGEEDFSSSAKDFSNVLDRERVEHPFL